MEEISLKAEEIANFLGFSVTNSLLLTFFVSSLLILFSLFIYKKINIIPGKTQSLVEISMEWFLGLMESTLGSLQKAKRYFPLVATIFIFILFPPIEKIFRL